MHTYLGVGNEEDSISPVGLERGKGAEGKVEGLECIKGNLNPSQVECRVKRCFDNVRLIIQTDLCKERRETNTL
jgi:hypothetical protein